MRLHFWVATAYTGLLLSCSGGTKSEQPAPPAPSASDDTRSLALCLEDGAIPPGATHCRLDLNLVGDNGSDSYWRDTDGMDPGTAGCSEVFTTDSCTDWASAISFGEFCVDEDRLIETADEAGVCHILPGDLSTLQVVSCTAWCATQGSAAGRCEPFVAVEFPGGN